MQAIFLRWVSSNSRHSSKLLQHPQHLRLTVGNAHAELLSAAISARTAVRKSRNHSLRQVLGNANAVPWLPENSVPSAVLRSRLTGMAGLARAALRIKVNSARAAAPKNPRAHRSTAAINAAGSRRIRLIRRSSVPNAEIYSTITIKNKTAALRGNVLTKALFRSGMNGLSQKSRSYRRRAFAAA